MLGRVGGLFENLHDLLYLDNLDAIFLLLEEPLDKVFIHVVGLVLDVVQPGTILAQLSGIFAEAFELVHRLANAIGLLLHQQTQLLAALADGTGLVDGDALGTAVYTVDDIVHVRSQRLNIFPVEGGDEGGA